MKTFHPLTIAQMLMRTILNQEITRCGYIASGLIIERMARYWSLAEQFCQLDTEAHYDKDCTGRKWEPLLSHIT